MPKKPKSEAPAAPAPKATPLTILKVRRTRKHVAIEYQNGDEHHKLESRDNPLPAFDHAIAALAPLVCTILHLPETYTENMRAIGLTIADKGGNEHVTLIAQKSLDDAGSPFNIATPLRMTELPTAEGTYTPPLSDKQCALIDEVIEQAKAYVRGERAQGQIEFKEEDEGDDEDDSTAPLEFEHEAAVAAN